MTSGRLNETLSTGIFDMRPTEESLAIKAKNRKWRASKKEQELPPAMLGESDSVLVKLPSTPKREICRLMLRMLSSSTSSESLRLDDIF